MNVLEIKKEKKCKTHCRHGHEFTFDNTYIFKGRKFCRKCAALRANKHYDKIIKKETIRKRAEREKRTHCKKGHEYTLESTYISSIGNKQCKICLKDSRTKWGKNNKELLRRNRRHKLYGVSEKEYNNFLQVQDYKCKICGLQHSTDKPLSVDHCHETGRVRGLLCRNCNNGIGLLQHNIEVLQKAIDYLTIQELICQ